MTDAQETEVPKGPRGEWRPDDDFACAVHVGKIATGQIKDTKDDPSKKAEDKEKPAPAEAAE